MKIKSILPVFLTVLLVGCTNNTIDNNDNTSTCIGENNCSPDKWYINHFGRKVVTPDGCSYIINSAEADDNYLYLYGELTINDSIDFNKLIKNQGLKDGKLGESNVAFEKASELNNLDFTQEKINYSGEIIIPFDINDLHYYKVWEDHFYEKDSTLYCDSTSYNGLVFKVNIVPVGFSRGFFEIVHLEDIKNWSKEIVSL